MQRAFAESSRRLGGESSLRLPLLRSRQLVEIPSASVSELLQFEGAVLEMQHALEGSFKRASAACGERSVIIYDRGILDPAAFVPRSQWPALAESAPQLSGRPMSWYTCIMHLVTAADGARSVFETQVRHEHKESSAYSSKAAIEQAVGSAVEALSSTPPSPRCRVRTRPTSASTSTPPKQLEPAP